MSSESGWECLLSLDGVTYRSGKRVLGFDNAHKLRKGRPSDHWHRDESDAGREYEFDSPEALLADFWRQVDRVLKEHEDD